MGARRTAAAFFLSGAAGLVYESIWSRYLGLFVGHGAFAQTLVLSVYLGGMALGALVVADFSSRTRRPILWYAGAELVLAVMGLGFHWVFGAVTGFSYDVIFPAIADGRAVSSVRWVIAGLLILPQAMVLGSTFPLMAAALVRLDEGRPGRMVAQAYLLNTLGGAVGVLLAGFWLVEQFGLPGTTAAAALLNIAAAGLVWSAFSGASGAETGLSPVETGPPAAEAGSPRVDAQVTGSASHPEEASSPGALGIVLLLVAGGTALASFAYEIGWIRMLSLVLGSASHSFELMLSAFILGLGIGAWVIRSRADSAADSVRLLAKIQIAMGCAAVLSIPLFYWLSFDVMAALVGGLSGRTDGYFWFNVARYGLCLVVMLPASLLAGTTLPLITASLIRAGGGETAIGRVYAVNTLGSVIGAAAAGLVLLPMLGVKGLIVAGAGLDALIGLLLLLWRPDGQNGRRWGRSLAVAGAVGLLFAWVGGGLQMDPSVLSSGVYRRGEIRGANEHLSLFYADGRTATVSAYVGRSDGVVVLATNGKPDASLGPRWLVEQRDTLVPRPIPRGRDFTTQVLAPVVALAHLPEARNVANIGHGSGVTATAFLTREEIERVVTIEIEPLMVQGSLVFLPINGPALADPRSSFVFDDAKAYFAYQRERFDIVFAEPSNPWVSGTASLFTHEFYARASGFVADGGVFAQWIQVYELTDELFLSVLAALDAVFPSYRAYLVGDGDIAIVASLDEELPATDWAILDSERLLALTEGIPPFRPSHMEALVLFDQTTFRALLDGENPAANSDYYPILDSGAERARFEQRSADGAYSFATSRVDIARALRGTVVLPEPYAAIPAYGLVPSVVWGRSAWIRDALAAGGGIAPVDFPEWEGSLLDLRDFLEGLRSGLPPDSWEAWSSRFGRVEASLHWGTNLWVDSTFYAGVFDYLDAHAAPPLARAVVDLIHGSALGDWDRAARAGSALALPVAGGVDWLPPDVLVDWTVVATVQAGRPEEGRAALTALRSRSGRAPGDLRMMLLDALVDHAGTRGGR